MASRSIKIFLIGFLLYYSCNYSGTRKEIIGLDNGAYREITYYDDQKFSDREYNRDSVLNGISKFYKNNLVDVQTNFVNGKMTGEYYQFYPSGNIFYYGNLINRKKDGKWITFYDYPGKRIFSIQHFIKDSLTGTMIEHFENEEIKSFYLYKDTNILGKIICDSTNQCISDGKLYFMIDPNQNTSTIKDEVIEFYFPDVSSWTFEHSLVADYGNGLIKLTPIVEDTIGYYKLNYYLYLNNLSRVVIYSDYNIKNNRKITVFSIKDTIEIESKQ